MENGLKECGKGPISLAFVASEGNINPEQLLKLLGVHRNYTQRREKGEFRNNHPENLDFNLKIPLIIISLLGPVLPLPVATPLYLTPLFRACSEPGACAGPVCAPGPLQHACGGFAALPSQAGRAADSAPSAWTSPGGWPASYLSCYLLQPLRPCGLFYS